MAAPAPLKQTSACICVASSFIFTRFQLLSCPRNSLFIIGSQNSLTRSRRPIIVPTRKHISSAHTLPLSFLHHPLYSHLPINAATFAVTFFLNLSHPKRVCNFYSFHACYIPDHFIHLCLVTAVLDGASATG